MKLIRGINNLPQNWKGCALTIGNFDGLHLGHQQLISHCIGLSKQIKKPSVLLTFEPYPKAFFEKNENIPRLTSLRDKFLQLDKFGIDYLCVLPFNKALASMSANEFIQSILVDHLKAEAVVVGDDFRFGAKRAGDVSLLRDVGKEVGFVVEQAPTCVYQGERVSSSRLREVLQSGDLKLAEGLLGRHYCLSGPVVKGDQRGEAFGYPTANIYIGQKKLALSGIFFVMVEGLEKKPLPGVASIGYRPMFPTEKDVLEVYLLNFDRNIYQQHCSVIFLKKLREEMNFPSEEELVKQIDSDIEKAIEFFAG